MDVKNMFENQKTSLNLAIFGWTLIVKINSYHHENHKLYSILIRKWLETFKNNNGQTNAFNSVAISEFCF